MTKFYIVCHKLSELPALPGYVPILVGAKDFSIPGSLRDDSGEEISRKNPNFNELTALYWIWKNDRSDFVGLCHYRRYFMKGLSPRRYLTISEAERDLRRHDIILPEPITGLRTTVRELYLRTGGREKDLEALESLIEERLPDDYPAYRELMGGYSASYYNMAVMPRALLERYCGWLFPLLFELERRIDLSGRSEREGRVFGFLAERLLNVFVRTERLRVRRRPVYVMGEKNYSLRILSERARQGLCSLLREESAEVCHQADSERR